MSDQAAMFDTDDRQPWQRSSLELADPSANSVGASHFKDGDETEAAAARLVEPRTGTNRLRVLRAIKDAGEQGRTVYELAEQLGLILGSTGPRLTELRDAGWIVAAPGPRATPSGASAFVWVLSTRGRESFEGATGS